MAQGVKRKAKPPGLPPGTLVHVGKPSAAPPRITVLDYDGGHCEATSLQEATTCGAFKDTPTVTWINVAGVQDVHLIEQIGSQYGIHPLLLEDIVNTQQRAKVEDYGDYLFIVLHMLTYGQETGSVESEQVSLVVGPHWVLTFQEDESDVFGPLRTRLEQSRGRLRSAGADYLAYSLMDAVVDNYFVILEQLGDRVEELEDDVVSHPDEATLRTIHLLKREMVTLRRAVWPLREVISSLRRGESPLIADGTRMYFADVYDHTVQVIETIENMRDVLAGMLDIYLSSITYRMDSVIKVLTIIATIFIPLTFLAGVYGMNFKYMPELEWPWGYPLIWAVMIGVGVSMLVVFKRKKWF